MNRHPNSGCYEEYLTKCLIKMPMHHKVDTSIATLTTSKQILESKKGVVDFISFFHREEESSLATTLDSPLDRFLTDYKKEISNDTLGAEEEGETKSTYEYYK